MKIKKVFMKLNFENMSNIFDKIEIEKLYKSNHDFEFFDIEKLNDFNNFIIKNIIIHENIIILYFDNDNIIIIIINEIIFE